ncbi:MAG: class I SAM-dependent methyltransferase [Cyanobacteria bacterium CRU_2_1]|nr:class I SAM-dependent methyltransferase [Cyanobacteria bacterium CRU_2_1]
MAITYPDTYLLANSSTELDRLYLQAKVWEPEAEVMLDHIAVQPGWKCVDLGCGGMSILQSLSRRVGIQGHIIGVDNDPRQLAAACDYVRDNQLENVDILEQDIYHTRLPREFFDLTHARCLFAAANHDEELLREMLSLTRSGGILAIQEPDVTSWKCYPTDPAWEQLNRIVLDAFKPGGSDFNVGQRIFKMLRHAGLEDVNQNCRCCFTRPTFLQTTPHSICNFTASTHFRGWLNQCF